MPSVWTRRSIRTKTASRERPPNSCRYVSCLLCREEAVLSFKRRRKAGNDGLAVSGSTQGEGQSNIVSYAGF